MELLNKKSILECNEDEEILHNEEITNIERKIHKLPNYDCAIIYNFLNFPKKKEIIKSCKLHDFMEMIEYTDFKNGIDLFASEINEFEILAYGGMFENDNKLDFFKTIIKILPYDEQKNFINIINFIN